MEKHLFEGVGRVRAESLATVRVKRWLPPEIDAQGKLIPVEPREEPVRRPVAAREEISGDPAEPDAVVIDSDAITEEARARGYAEGERMGYEEGLARGREEGLAKGHAEGLDQGLADGKAQVTERLREINRLATSLTHALNEQDYQLEQALMNLVQEVARQVIQRELQIDNAVLMKLVRQALDTLPPSRDNVRIMVHPDDLPILEEAIAEGGENWRAIARKDISRGGCRVETDQSVVDFTTDYRFRRLMEQIMTRELSVPEGTAEVEEEALELAPKPVVKVAKGEAGNE
jgi:flagellar assembly protein FliH